MTRTKVNNNKHSRKALKALLQKQKEQAEEKRLLSLLPAKDRVKWEVYRGVLVEKSRRVERIRLQQEIEAWFATVPLFRTVTELKQCLLAYFVDTFTLYNELPTPTGLKNAVGGRERWNYYKAKAGKWASVLQTAESYMVKQLEEDLLNGKNSTGTMFILKNEYGWRSSDPKDSKTNEDAFFRTQVSELLKTNFAEKPITYKQPNP